MKKFINSILFFSLLGTLCTSCASDMFEPAIAGDGNFNLSVSIPCSKDMRTRTENAPSFGDGTTINELKCYVYNRDKGLNAEPIAVKDLSIVDGDDGRNANISLKLPTGVSYDFVFLATAVPQNNTSSKVFYDPSSRVLNVNYDKISVNDEDVDCFWNVLTDVSSANKSEYSVTLKRPFAQLNIGTKDMAQYNTMSASPISSVGVSVDGIYSALNVMDGSLVGDASVAEFSAAAPPVGHVFPTAHVDYLAMDYLLVDDRKTVNVDMMIANADRSFDVSLPYIPVQRNCQTVVSGNLLTESNDYTVYINPMFNSNEFHNGEDPYEEYDLVLETIDIENRFSDFNLIHSDGTMTNIDLLPFEDSNHIIKLKFSDVLDEWNEMIREREDVIGFSLGRLTQHVNEKDSHCVKSIIKCDLSKFPYKIESLSSCFYDMRNLESISNFNLQNVENITDVSYMYGNCYKLTKIDMVNMDVSKLTNLDYMFFNCTSLKDVSMKNLVLHGNSNFLKSKLFAGCELSSLDISGWDVSEITDLRDLCLTGYRSDVESYPVDYLNMSNWKTSNVVYLPDVFQSAEIYADYSGWDISNVINLDGQFAHVQAISLNLSNWKLKNEIHASFGEDGDKNKHRELDLSGWDFSDYVGSIFSFYNNFKLAHFDTVNVSNWNLGPLNKLNNCFQNCIYIKNIIGLSTWNVSNITSTEYMFSRCSSLQSVGDLSGWDVSNVTFMTNMFINCSSLQSLGDISKWNVSNVTDMSSMFSNCSSLQSLGDISKWNVSNVTNMDSMFLNCSSLQSLGDISKWNVSNVTKMMNMFEGCSGKINCSTWNFKGIISTYMQKMFANCKEYTEIDLSNTTFPNTSDKVTFRNVFNGSSGLVKLNLSNVDLANIKAYSKDSQSEIYLCFGGCTSLTDIIGPVFNISANINFKDCPLTNESALVILNGLKSNMSNTVTFSESTYNTLTEEQIKIATDKGWTVAH